MTTKELIQQYVTAHADNRWMDASELETLLTEFAEKLKEPASEDLQEHINECWQTWVSSDNNPIANGDLTKEEFEFYARHFAQWQKEQMMKDAISGVIFGSRYFRQKNISLTNLSEEQYNKLKDFGERVKLIIIKE